MKSTTLAVLSASLLLSYCSGNSVSNMDLIDHDEALALRAINDPYGVFGNQPEAVKFNDDKVVSISSEEVNYNDPYAFSEDASLTTGLTALPVGCDIYNIVFKWGQLQGFTHDNDAELTWSGSISVNAGTLAVTKTLAFDDRDSVSPRTDSKVIDFISYQKPHYDGLKVKYAVCPTDEGTLPVGVEPTLTFSSPSVPFTKSYTVSQLRLLRELTPVDDDGDNFLVRSVLKSDLCQGTISGEWNKTDYHFGTFKGQVVASNGIVLGHVKGVSNQFTETDKRWAAKFIRHNGNYIAFMTGTFDDSQFNGDIFKTDDLNTDRGDLDGSYVKVGPGSRVFTASYTLDCADVSDDEAL